MKTFHCEPQRPRSSTICTVESVIKATLNTRKHDIEVDDDDTVRNISEDAGVDVNEYHSLSTALQFVTTV